MRTAAAFLLPAAVSALLLVCCGPVGALPIGFIQPAPGSEITASTDIPGAVVTTGPSLATVNRNVASYLSSDSPPWFPPAVGLTGSTLETGLVQNVLALLLPLPENGPLDLDVTARGAVETSLLQSVPEPGTLLLFGSTLAGLGLVARRWQTR
jgi:hypothetical protein